MFHAASPEGHRGHRATLCRLFAYSRTSGPSPADGNFPLSKPTLLRFPDSEDSLVFLDFRICYKVCIGNLFYAAMDSESPESSQSEHRSSTV